MRKEGLSPAHCRSLSSTGGQLLCRWHHASCQRHAPARDRQTAVPGLAGRQVLTRSYDFHYQREPRGAAGAYCTSDSFWQRLQRSLLEVSAGSLPHEKEACELPISSETFALTWLHCCHVPDVQGTEPYANKRVPSDSLMIGKKTTLESASVPACDGWFA